MRMGCSIILLKLETRAIALQVTSVFLRHRDQNTGPETVRHKAMTKREVKKSGSGAISAEVA